MRLLALLILCLACSDPLPPATVELRVITADSRDPFEVASLTRATFALAQGDADPITVTEELDETFDVGLVLPDLTARTRTRVLLDDAEGLALHGAAPSFVPVASGGLVRVVVGPPGTCAIVGRASLPTGRVARGHALADTFAVLVAGTDPAGAPSAGVTSIDLLRFDTLDDQTTDGRLPALEGLRGPARAASLATSKLVIVSDDAAVRYDLGVFTDREAPLNLHDGAAATSAVGSVGSAAVVAGPTARFTWITAEERLIEQSLASARASAALAALGEVALLAGGELDPEAPVAELLRPTGSAPIVGPDPGVRRDGVLLVSGDRALLVGGLDAAGEPRTDTVLFEGCPDDCRATAGPTWEHPRPGIVAAGDLLVGGNRVERFDGAAMLEHATLTVSRRAPLAARLDGGLLLVAGGEGDPSPRTEVELCFPAELTPL